MQRTSLHCEKQKGRNNRSRDWNSA